MALNLNRGVTMRKHPSGMAVAMYDDTPGSYMTERGEPLDAEFAKQAGFNVGADQRRAAVNKRVADYQKQLEDELKSEEDALASIMSDAGNYDVRHIGGGQYAIFDKDGERMTRVAMTKKDVELLIGPIDVDIKDEVVTEAPTAPTVPDTPVVDPQKPQTLGQPAAAPAGQVIPAPTVTIPGAAQAQNGV